MSQRKNTLVFEVPITPKTPDEKLLAFRQVLESAISNRMQVLKSEAQTISLDMEALIGRLSAHGHEAQLSDIRSARWYRTAAQLAILKDLYRAYCNLAGIDDAVVRMVVESESAEISSGEVEDTIDD
jgi:hypothetical protein